MDGELIARVNPGRGARDIPTIEHESRARKNRYELRVPFSEGHQQRSESHSFGGYRPADFTAARGEAGCREQKDGYLPGHVGPIRTTL